MTRVLTAPSEATAPQTTMWRGCVAWALMGESMELTRRTVLLLDDPAVAQSLGAHFWALEGGALWVGLLGICVGVWVCSVLFARGPGRVLPLVLALVGTGVLYEALTIAKDDVPEFLVHGGVVGAGWLLGLLVARFTGAGRAELFAWRGGIGALAATYVKAGLAKLSAAGLGWVDPDTLRAIVLSHYDPTGPAVRIWIQDTILESPALAQGMLAYGLLVELGAILLLSGGRLRAFGCMGLISFHAGVYMATTDILFFSSFMFLFVVGWRVKPLEDLATRWLEPSREVPAERVSTRLLAWAAAALLALTALLWVVPTETLQGQRGDGMRRWVSLEVDLPVRVLHERLEPGALTGGWTLRQKSSLTDGAFSLWLQPPGEQRQAIPVVLADPRVPSPLCQHLHPLEPGVLACFPTAGAPVSQVLDLLR